MFYSYSSVSSIAYTTALLSKIDTSCIFEHVNPEELKFTEEELFMRKNNFMNFTFIDIFKYH